MKKILLRTVCFVLVAVFAAVLSGCGKDEDLPAFEAFVCGRVFDGEDVTSCGIIIENADTHEKKFDVTDYFGRFDIRLKKGEYTLTFLKDSQFTPEKLEVRVESEASLNLPDIRLTKLFDLSAYGYYSADLHQHSIYSDGKNTPLDMYLYNAAMGYGFAALSDHDSVDGNGEFISAAERTGAVAVIGGVEISSSDKGHINALGTANTYNSKFASADDVKASIARAKSDGAYVQINHPARGGGKGFAYIDDLPEFGFDGYELWNGRNAPSPLSGTNLQAKNIWFDNLNNGFYIPATAGSDNHGFAEQNVGMPRTYVRASDTTVEGFMQAIKAGRSFLSNGPVIIAETEGKSYGETVSPGEKEFLLKARYNAVIGKVNVLVNGETVLSFDAEGMSFTRNEALTLEAGDYVVTEIIAPDGGYALSNPIFCA